MSEQKRSEVSAEAGGDSARDQKPLAAARERAARTSDTRSLGNAMRSLFESADVSIARGDETRVLSRAQDALLEVEERAARNSPSPPPVHEPELFSTGPPGPRVDAVLWLVLAAGLFAIVGWMLAYGL